VINWFGLRRNFKEWGIIVIENTPKGNRKTREAHITGILLLIGFIFGAYVKVETAMFTVFVAGMVGKMGTLVYGNVKEHQVDATKPA
jgi:hypothetical protein